MNTFFIDKLHGWWQSLVGNIIKDRDKIIASRYLNAKATDWSHPSQKSPQTHRQLIERVINYVVFYNASPKKIPIKDIGLMAHTLRQEEFLKVPEPTSGALNFDYLSKDERRIEPQSNHVIAAYFDEDLLSEALQPEEFKQHLLIISNLGHACALMYRDSPPKYGFYDSDKSVNSIAWHPDKTSLTKAIFSQLGHNLSLTMVSISEPLISPFKAFHLKFSKPEFQALMIRHNSLPFIARFNPSLAAQVANKSNLADKAKLASISEHLLQNIVRDWPGFAVLGRYSDRILQRIINAHEQDSAFLHAIMNKLKEQTAHGDTFLYILLLSAPTSLNTLYRKFSDKDHLSQYVLAALRKWEARHWHTIQHESSHTVKAHLKKLLTYASCASEYREGEFSHFGSAEIAVKSEVLAI